MTMNETPPIKSHNDTSSSQLLRHTLNVTLMGILSSCAVQKPVSIDTLTKYPSASEVSKRPFFPEASDDIKNLSNFFLKESNPGYVDDNGNTMTP